MSFLDRLRRRPKASAPSPGGQVSAAAEITESDLTEVARRAVLPGFVTQPDAVERVREVLDLDETDPRPERVVELIWSRRAAELSTWEGRSDHDRLTAAFRQLEAQGFVTRMSFTCCTTCGSSEINEERTVLDPDAEYPYRETMYTFFHEQDAERLIDEPAILFLAYSAWRPAPDTDPELHAAARAGDDDARAAVAAATDAAVGHRIVDALRAEGLDVSWNGSHTSRIAVTISRWRRPLPV